MTVRIYADPAGGLHLQPPPNHRMVAQVEAPQGSELKTTKLFGTQLFVPVDEWQSWAWGAWEILQAAREGRKGFRVLM